MSKPLFSKLIICKNCLKRYKAKKDRKRFYVCSTYDNLGKDYCERGKVDQDYLLELLERRFERRLTEDEIKKEVNQIVTNGKEIVIYLENQQPIEIRDNVHIY